MSLELPYFYYLLLLIIYIAFIIHPVIQIYFFTLGFQQATQPHLRYALLLVPKLNSKYQVSLQVCSHEWIQRSSTRNVRFAKTSSHQHNSRELVKSVIVYSPGRSNDPIKVLERRIFVDLERIHDMQKGQRWLTLHFQMIIKYAHPWENIGRMTIKMVPDRFKL